MTLDLPDSLTASPEQEALALGLEHLIFDPIEEDAKRRRDESDETTPPLRAYALLDAAQSPDIPICLEGFSNPARCLFDGDAYDNLAEVAPWLVELTRYSDVWDWFVEEGYGKDWGILIHSRLPLPRLKTQLKRFLRVEDEDSDVYFFKYYRPEIFNKYVPRFDSIQRSTFWREIEAIYSEYHRDPQKLIRHHLDGEHVEQEYDILSTGRRRLKTSFELNNISGAYSQIER
ncbi:DUF4123 domain-containing protein [Paracoccus onubensis]|nr:DUF4123 domain-containing protein [Paracoccus onubensis]